MKVLITGATGLIGSALVKKCLTKGYSINYLTTRKSKIEHKNNYNGFFWNPSKNEYAFGIPSAKMKPASKESELELQTELISTPWKDHNIHLL